MALSRMALPTTRAPSRPSDNALGSDGGLGGKGSGASNSCHMYRRCKVGQPSSMNQTMTGGRRTATPAKRRKIGRGKLLKAKSIMRTYVTLPNICRKSRNICLYELTVRTCSQMMG